MRKKYKVAGPQSGSSLGPVRTSRVNTPTRAVTPDTPVQNVLQDIPRVSFLCC